MSNVNKRVLRDALKGVSVPDSLRMGSRRWYQMKDTKDPNDDFLTQTIEAMRASGNNIILDHICDEAGGVFVRYEESGQSTGNLHQDASDMLSELTDVYTVMSKSMKDGKIDMQEAAEIRKEAKEAMQKIEVMLDNVQKGKYQ